MDPRLSGKNCKSLNFFCLSHSQKRLEYKENNTTKDTEVYPESLGAMLEYWYIERGLLCWKKQLISWKNKET